MLSGMTAFSQLTDGFYRIQNKGSQRYLYVRDCTGEVSTLGADMGAIELWPELENAVSDPGSVICLKKIGSAFDLTSQGTGVYEMTGRYMNISYDGKLCLVYNSGQYLYEVGVSDLDANMGLLGAKTAKEMPGKSEYRLWIPYKVDSKTDCYFGFKPTLSANGKYYLPFYADFAYTPCGDSKTWYVSKVDQENGVAVISQLIGKVARSQAVIVECASASPSDNRADLSMDGGDIAKNNVLIGTFFDDAMRSGVTQNRREPAIIPFDATTMRVLATDAEGNLVYVNSSETLPGYYVKIGKKWVNDVKCIPHNQSYLVVDASCPATLKVMTEQEYAKYIESLPVSGIAGSKDADTIYDLSGMTIKARREQLSKGVYIINKRKYIVR